jgi:predicted CoA-binding protein
MIEADVLKNYRKVAIIGVSANVEKASNIVGKYLIQHGFDIFPVNPSESEILGQKAYPNLAAIPDRVEIVDIFRKSEDVGPIIDEAIRIGAKVVWMQEGVKNEEAATKARQAGLLVIMDKCMKKTHENLTKQGII